MASASAANILLDGKYAELFRSFQTHFKGSIWLVSKWNELKICPFFVCGLCLRILLRYSGWWRRLRHTKLFVPVQASELRFSVSFYRELCIRLVWKAHAWCSSRAWIFKVPFLFRYKNPPILDDMFENAVLLLGRMWEIEVDGQVFFLICRQRVCLNLKQFDFHKGAKTTAIESKPSHFWTWVLLYLYNCHLALS